jgi:tripartite ATP-independent transporter DctM subunit
MNWPLTIFLLMFLLTFLLRIPIAFGMIMSSIFYFTVATGPAATIGMAANQFLSNMNVSFILLAVPLFIFAANIMNTGAVTELVFRFANTIVGRWKGGMGHVNVLASLIFSGMTGSAVADASGLGLMEVEAMRRSGYDDPFSCGITAASATIGPVFPPSIPMIFYSMLSGASVGALFMGGMVPGVLMAVFLMAYVAYISRKRNYPTGARVGIRQFVRDTLQALPALLTPVILLGGIYTGVVTPTEAGALASLWALVISVAYYRSLGWRQLVEVLKSTAKMTGTVSIIVGAAFSFSYIIAIEHIPAAITQLFLNLTTNKYAFLFVVNVLFLALGMFMDTMAIMLVFVPIVLPIVNQLGIDLVHFGVVIVLNMMIGLLTPPYGVLLFIVSGISKTPLKHIIKESLPMTCTLIGLLFLMTYVPEVVLFVPRLFGQIK